MAIQIQIQAVCCGLHAQRMQAAGCVRVFVCVDRNGVLETSSQRFKNSLLGSTEVHLWSTSLVSIYLQFQQTAEEGVWGDSRILEPPLPSPPSSC